MTKSLFFPYLLFCLSSLIASTAFSKIDPGGIGYWTFKKPNRPVKAVIIGGSISAFPAGNYGQALEKVCSNLEIVNRAKSKLGAHHLYLRFVRQVLRNPNIKKHRSNGLWLFYHGGLNSVQNPYGTNKAILKTFRDAHQNNLKVVGMSLLPWGDDSDYRWKGEKGLKAFHNTNLVVDFVLGRLSPKAALGKDRSDPAFLPHEKADVAINLYDTDLRAKNAPRRSDKNLANKVRVNYWVKKNLASVEASQRPNLLKKHIDTAYTLPQWYMKHSLRSIDHFHPGRRGHKIVANEVCQKLPKKFGCTCEPILNLKWQKGQYHLLEGPAK